MQRRWLPVLFFLALDQAIKVLVTLRIPLGTTATSAGPFSIVHTQNTGVTFGLFQGSNTIMIFVSLAAALGVTWYLRRSTHDTPGLILLLAGILGNFIDRIVHGGVIDYLSIGSFPVFNLADSMIVTGIALIILNDIPGVKKHLPWAQNSSNSSRSSK